MNREKYYLFQKWIHKYIKYKRQIQVVFYTLKNEGIIHDFFCCLKWTKLEKCRSPPSIN